MVRASDGFDCAGTYLGGTQGKDAFWGDGSGAFRGSDNNRASSVMNSGYIGDLDIVAFYRLANYSGGYPANNNISSHHWVNSCSKWLT